MAQPKRKRTSTHTHESDAEGDRDESFVAEEEEATEEAVLSAQGVPDGCPFMVDYRTAAKKSKSKAKSAKKQRTGPTTNNGPPPLQQLDQDPPEDTTVYTVKPKTKWDSLKKYRNFVGASTFCQYSFHVSGASCSEVVLWGDRDYVSALFEGLNDGVF